MAEQKLKKLPLGISDFKKNIDGDYVYVDKTKLIYNTAHEALEQIQDKKYYEKFLNTDKQITLVGINFESKTKTVLLEACDV